MSKQILSPGRCAEVSLFSAKSSCMNVQLSALPCQLWDEHMTSNSTHRTHLFFVLGGCNTIWAFLSSLQNCLMRRLHSATCVSWSVMSKSNSAFPSCWEAKHSASRLALVSASNGRAPPSLASTAGRSRSGSGGGGQLLGGSPSGPCGPAEC